MEGNKLVSLALLSFFVTASRGFYIPGVAPREYKKGEVLDIRAVKMTSIRTQLPYEYYSLQFCHPLDDELHYKSLNLGEVLRGDRIVTTPYVVKVMENDTCSILCKVDLDKKQTAAFIERIEEDYTVHMLADNLPAATVFRNLKTDELQYEDGYKLGFKHQRHFILNNYLTIVINYHKITRSEEVVYRIVGFEVDPRSVSMDSIFLKTDKKTSLKDKKVEAGAKCALEQEVVVTELSIKRLEEEAGRGLLGDIKGATPSSGLRLPSTLPIKSHLTIAGLLSSLFSKPSSVVFAYRVVWHESNVAWASRWDIYLQMSDVQIHWFAICNSVAIVLFLSGVLALIIIRTLWKDIARYNKDDEMDEVLEETGWKLVHGDVFRPPAYPTLLVACLGSGIQIFCMVLIIIVFAMFGMLSPASRGALMTAAIVLFMFMGATAGYHSARMFKTLRGNNWKKAATLTATLYPGIVFGMGFFLNFFIWGEHSSGAVPFTTMLALVCMWFGISFPLVFSGFYFGFRKIPYEHPVRTNQIPRQVPDQVWYLQPVLASLISGILPFGAVFVELFFILSAIWENQFYYLFGFLFLVFIILIIACSEVAIVMTYFQLCGEDYHWWWRSFLLSGSSSFYVLAYSFVYYCTKLNIVDFIPSLLYFGYTLVMVIGFWLLTGTIGFYTTYFFICRIYAAVKQD